MILNYCPALTQEVNTVSKEFKLSIQNIHVVAGPCVPNLFEHGLCIKSKVTVWTATCECYPHYTGSKYTKGKACFYQLTHNSTFYLKQHRNLA